MNSVGELLILRGLRGMLVATISFQPATTLALLFAGQILLSL